MNLLEKAISLALKAHENVPTPVSQRDLDRLVKYRRA
jgi:hypothetical protein